MAKSDYLVYPAVFDSRGNDDPNHYTVTFPDVPDTVTQGATLAEAVKRAPDALAVALPDYPTYPVPTPIEKVQADNPGTIVSYVGVDMKAALRRDKNRTVRKNVTIPYSLAEAAKDKDINFSEVLADGLRAKLAQEA